MDINVSEYDRLAKEIYAPVYPVIAEQIKQKTGITEGVCVDLGCGGGYLGIALAKITNLTVNLFDLHPEMQIICERNILEHGLAGRATAVLGDVHDLPFLDQSMDLVISRGSIFFWDDLAKAFQEIYRVLAPGGKTLLGGGFGTPELLAQITEKMKQIDGNTSWRESVRKRLGPSTKDNFSAMLEKAGIPDYKIEQSEIELWVIMSREMA
jgi:ubiquinone/menaquinone biosynthesis C-methylase UbiE